ncbi:MAG: glycosyl transferase, partial [Ilumatobacteraceae bacterium]
PGGFPAGQGIPGQGIPGQFPAIVPGQGIPGQGAPGQFPAIVPGANGQPPAIPGGGNGQPSSLPGAAGGPGNFLDAGTPSHEVVQFLEDGKSGFTYALATIGANSAAGYQLATDDPVMAIGGFNGTDQWPTLAAFQQMVADRAIHYFVAGGGFPGGGFPGGGQGGGPGSATTGTTTTSTQISSWVTANFTSVVVDGTTFYDLTAAVG